MPTRAFARTRSSCRISAIGLGLLAAPGLAQAPAALPEGRFVDYAGRSVELTLGAPGPGLTPGTRTVAELAAEFKRLCVDTRVDKALFDAAAKASSYGYVPDPFSYVFGRKRELSLDFGGWKTADVSVRLMDFGNTFMKGLQCNLTAAVVSPADRPALTAALTSIAGVDLGSPAGAKAGKRGVFEMPVAGGTLVLMGMSAPSSSHPIVHFGATIRPAKK